MPLGANPSTSPPYSYSTSSSSLLHLKPSLNPSSPMSIPQILTLTLVLLASTTSVAADQVHELLKSHGLPAGLLPKSVASFSFSPDTGLLEVTLDSPCYAKYDGLAYFDRVVRGNLSYGELEGVVGLKQEELFVWLPVKGILVSNPSSGVILFDIGLARKQLSLSLFEVPPDCTPEDEAGAISMVVANDDAGSLGRKGRNQSQHRKKMF
ncbi:uncharacterized protein M6B38_190350 [Iris pallida]|uniref:DUF538 family protein n=1 Tax=Iris pallida TaxID=29817 RepID=A0AAX6EG08_IRIPA|nr:uncharacterized protein M6B38_190350 [Iris pallida]